MNFGINISPGVWIFILGFVGLIFSLAEDSVQVVGKAPLIFMFLFVIIIGMVIEIKMKDNGLETFGEMDSDRKFG